MKNILTTKYDINSEPIVLSKVTSDILLKQEKPADVLALYVFYYITAKWQNQKNARCTTEYAANGLKWTGTRIRKTKKILIELGLIENVIKKDSTGKIIGHYVRVNFKWIKEHYDLPTDHPYEIAQCGQNDSVVNRKTNTTYTLSKIQQEEENKKNTKEKTSKKYFKLATKLSKIIQTKKNIKHTSKQLNQWSIEFKRLHKENKVNINRQKEILKWYKLSIGGEFIPVIESGKSFREKFIRLEDAKNRINIKPKRNNSVGYQGGFQLTKESIKM